MQAAGQRFGGIDVLCHLAGGFRMGEAVHETSDATWDFLLDLNARTLINIAHAVVPVMLAAGGGRIVTVGAGAAQKGAGRMGAYCAAKASVIRLTEAMSAELREQGINVNCVLPSIIDTPENRADMPQADPSRWVAPAALADVIAFLASDAARAVHGAALPVTGLSRADRGRCVAARASVPAAGTRTPTSGPLKIRRSAPSPPWQPSRKPPPTARRRSR